MIGVSASGRTPYTLGALRAARDAGALTAAVVCAPGSPMAAAADHAVVLAVGPEVIAGSTRLKAGTAQKLALNAFSTALMVRRGRTYGNLMSSMRVANAKLRERAVRICSLAARLRRRARRARRSPPRATTSRWRSSCCSPASTGRGARAPGGRGQRAGGGAMRLGVAAALVDGELLPGDVEVDDGVVTRAGRRRRRRAAGSPRPGFVDLQVNGFAGVDFQAADRDGYARAGEALLAPASPRSSRRSSPRRRPTSPPRCAAMPADGCGPRVIGAHLEGPFLSPRAARRARRARAAARPTSRCCGGCSTPGR